jgi:phage terminase small subunit
MDLEPNKKWCPEVLQFWQDIHEQYQFERDSLELFRVCCDSYNRFILARDILDEKGMVLVSETGASKQNPAWSIEKHARADFLRFSKALGIGMPKPKQPGRPSARIGI